MSESQFTPRAALSAEEKRQLNAVEQREWQDSLAYVLADAGLSRAAELIDDLQRYAYLRGAPVEYRQSTPYINSIPASEQPDYPGDAEMELRIRNILRWNSVVMVVRANKHSDGIGGHLSTYSSIAELYEVGFNHFFRGLDAGKDHDMVFFQGHSTPGIYARSFLEGRFNEDQIKNFRREMQSNASGLSSYPHPYLMRDYWEFPTVSMGLGPLQAIYQARFIKYLESRGLKEKGDSKVWAFLGDGEIDEPQSIGAIRFAAYENLDNLIFVINANLQRLDGPVRANSQVIQEFEALFRGAGWNVLKVVWGSGWDRLLTTDKAPLLLRRFQNITDGESMRYAAFGASELREHFFNTPELKELIEGWSDDDLAQLNRGGHDVNKIYAAYKAAVEHKGSPTLVIAQSVKGHSLGESAEARYVAHNVKKLDFSAMKQLRDVLNIPLNDEQVEHLELYFPGADSPEVKYMKEHREKLGGFLPARREEFPSLHAPGEAFTSEFAAGSGERKISTTMAAVSMMGKLLRDKEIGKYIVPIVPDEARTFGMDALVPRVGIYSPRGQTYTPVDSGSLMFYKETADGQILEEGITEDGAMASFIAAGTAYAHWGVPTIPMFMLYSMFGMQRVGDLVWAAGDQLTKGFIFGGTAGRTTLAGEGLQHQDGNSHLQAYVVPNLRSYDPAFAFEIATIVNEGIQRMYGENKHEFYYITVDNENEMQPAMPEDKERVTDGIMRGMYLFQPAQDGKAKLRAQILAGGPAMDAAMHAVEMLKEYDVAADLWSVTSYKELHQDALLTQRWNMLHPTEEAKVPFVAQVLNEKDAPGVLVSVSDYVKLGADGLNGHLSRKLWTLGTDGFGRSEARAELRDFFEVDAKHVVLATLHALQREGKVEGDVVAKAIKDFGIDPERPAPVLS